ncbi:uncharacterized protein LOC116356262 [Oncorhynchus kisutch]|uniref:uncharacterized protein LOC116356262 n=1 Tax=Oncorhynchus kisutch TaxID=8019 RepID=UPI0012DD0FB6|nr:uncharacterized protein LOC116356262 [Oncorhynchus kisutch]XP_031656868.1 uncharacterized protein LOC116356262 [Oncorhynchus kisutch]
MDNLYTCLKREIASFQDHVQQCKHSFNMDALHPVLSALTTKEQDEIHTLEQLRDLLSKVQEEPAVEVSGYGDSEIKRCITWLLSFVEYLSAMKETFDEKVVVPLCENLYVTEEDESTVASSDQTVPFTSDPQSPPHTSVTKVANELLVLRRRWALMLAPGPIKAENFSLLTNTDGAERFTERFAKIQWLVPDILYKSSRAAQLAYQWVNLHQCGHRGRRVGASVLEVTETAPMRSTGREASDEYILVEVERRREGMAGQAQARLMESRMELMALAGKEHRVLSLEVRLEKVTYWIQDLQAKLRQERLMVESGAQQEASDVGERTTEELVLNPSLELERRLRMERYHQKILLGDLLMQLKIRPVLIRYTDMVRDRCKQQEETLRAMEGSMGTRFPSKPESLNLSKQ